MKKGRGGILAILILLSGIATGQVKDKEIMINRIFSVLKNGDEEGFVKLFPGASETKIFLQHMYEKDSAKLAVKEMMDTFLEKLTDEDLQKGYREEFKRAIELASVSGINLSKAAFVSFTADSAVHDEGGMKAPTLSGKIYFTAEDSACFMAYTDIIWFGNDGWYGVSINRIDRKSRENIPETTLLEEVTVDSFSTMTVDTARIEVPVPQKKNKSTKPPAKPVKTKTASVARKPEQ